MTEVANDCDLSLDLCESEEGIAINYLKSLDNLMKEYSDLSENVGGQNCEIQISNETLLKNNFNFNIMDYQKIKSGFNVNNRMETILEEPSSTKLTVKEILAKFETLNEGDTVIHFCLKLLKLCSLALK